MTAVAINRHIAAGAILRVLKVALGTAQCTSCCVKVEAPAPAHLTRLASLYGSCRRAHGCCRRAPGSCSCRRAHARPEGKKECECRQVLNVGLAVETRRSPSVVVHVHLRVHRVMSSVHGARALATLSLVSRSTAHACADRGARVDLLLDQAAHCTSVRAGLWRDVNPRCASLRGVWLAAHDPRRGRVEELGRGEWR